MWNRPGMSYEIVLIENSFRVLPLYLNGHDVVGKGKMCIDKWGADAYMIPVVSIYRHGKHCSINRHVKLARARAYHHPYLVLSHLLIIALSIY
jgi:hypothetical protein